MTAIIIDDIETARQNMLNALMSFSNDVTVIAEAQSVKTAVAQIQKYQPDIVFIDVELGDGNAFDVLSQIDYKKHHIVFVTAFEKYAIRAFRFATINYLLKPIDTDDLELTIDKIKTQVVQHNIEVTYQQLLASSKKLEQKPTHVILKTGGLAHKIAINDIVRCQSESNYTTFYLQGGKTLLTSITLKEYEILFEEHHFFRTHQSHLINLDYVSFTQKTNYLFINLKTGEDIPLSIRKRPLFEKWFFKI